MRAIKRPRIAILASVLVMAGMVAGPFLPAGAATLNSPGADAPVPAHLVGRTVALPLKNAGHFDLAPTGNITIPNWSGSASYQGTTYPYTMVGSDPATPKAGTTTIQAVIIPVKFKIGSHTFDPGAKDPVCSAAASALTRFKSSPLVKNIPLTVGGTNIGTGQFVDLFQRANFYKDAMPTGVSPKYHTKLKWSYKPTVTVTVNGGALAGASCSGGALGLIDINSWDAYATGTLLPQLGIGPTQFPLFLFYDVVMYDGTASNCCILGYHSAELVPGGIQTYGVSNYDLSGDFSGSSDTSVLSHEIAEWLDDPFVNNVTPAWGNIGQVSGCQNNLEVGDPLTGTQHTIPLGGFNYHVQDLAFASWFYRQTPSIGVDGKYSLYGDIGGIQGVCS